MTLNVYLSGEIHTDVARRRSSPAATGLDLRFSAPVTDHAASDDCGVAILGAEPDKYLARPQGRACSTRSAPATRSKTADVVVVRFGDKYQPVERRLRRRLSPPRSGKSLVILQPPEHDHALKEVDAAALAVARDARAGGRHPALRAHRLAARLNGRVRGKSWRRFPRTFRRANAQSCAIELRDTEALPAPLT